MIQEQIVFSDGSTGMAVAACPGRPSRRPEVEEIRTKLVDLAQQNASRYLRECEEARPKAADLLETVIYPWWKEFKSPECFPVLRISTPIACFWPQEVLRELKSTAHKPCHYIAEYILDENRRRKERLGRRFDISIEEMIALRTESWFKVHGSAEVIWGAEVAEGETKHRLYAVQWSGEKEGGCVEVGIDPVNPQRPLLDTIHPIVLVRFAEQIEDGSVQQRIEKAIRKLQHEC